MKIKNMLLVFSSIFVPVSCGGTNPSIISSESTSEELTSIEETTIEETTSEESTSSLESSTSEEKEKIMEEKSVNVYRLFNRDNEYLDPDLSDEKYQLGSINFNFKKGEEFIPYITLNEMADLYGRFFKDKEKTENDVDIVGNYCTWSVISEDKEVFTSTIDIDAKTFTYNGEVESLIETKKDYTKYSLFLRSKTDNKTIRLDESTDYVIYYDDTEFEVIEEDNEVYFPFSMLHTFYHELTGHDFFYNYTYLYEYNSVDDLSKASVTEGDKLYTPLEQMSDYISEHVQEKDESNKPLMPLYLRKFHRSEFTLIMNNYYGLSETLGISSMSKFYDIYGLYENFIDEKSAVRGAAYSQAFFMLSDAHTGRTILGDDPWVETNGNTEINPATRSALTNERSLLSQSLTEQREAFLKANGFEDGIRNALIYSSDGKVAYFGFDGFEGTSKAFKNDGTVKTDEALASVDSYFYFVKQLKAVVAHNEASEVKVEKIIIDDSLNGGGYVATMGRILALLSKDNSAVITSISDITNVISKQTYHVDTNNDGVYDVNDVYGNMFKFYILTSPISFSCGNAFPIFARNQFSHVKVIGVKSGGGECIVGENYMSNGMGFVHSSNEHIIVLKDEQKGVFDGVEEGVSVDSTIRYNYFYNMEEMIKAISRIVE